MKAIEDKKKSANQFNFLGYFFYRGRHPDRIDFMAVRAPFDFALSYSGSSCRCCILGRHLFPLLPEIRGIIPPALLYNSVECRHQPYYLGSPATAVLPDPLYPGLFLTFFSFFCYKPGYFEYSKGDIVLEKDPALPHHLDVRAQSGGHPFRRPIRAHLRG